MLWSLENKNKSCDEKKNIKTCNPVNINCTWHWRRSWKEGKKIYTFIIFEIEVHPVIIKSTGEWNTGELWYQQHFNIHKLSLYFPPFFGGLHPDSNPSHHQPVTASCFLIWRNRTGDVRGRCCSLSYCYNTAHTYSFSLSFTPREEAVAGLSDEKQIT